MSKKKMEETELPGIVAPHSLWDIIPTYAHLNGL